jgi:hypothetical protein
MPVISAHDRKFLGESRQMKLCIMFCIPVISSRLSRLFTLALKPCFTSFRLHRLSRHRVVYDVRRRLSWGDEDEKKYVCSSLMPAVIMSDWSLLHLSSWSFGLWHQEQGQADVVESKVGCCCRDVARDADVGAVGSLL